MAEGIAKRFARKVALGTLEFEADEFEAVWLGAAKALNGESEALVGMVGDGQHSAGQIVILRPKVQKRFLRSPANSPERPGEGRTAAAILANFDSADGGELLEACLQFGREVHARN